MNVQTVDRRGMDPDQYFVGLRCGLLDLFES
jgi:hypothetical protein